MERTLCLDEIKDAAADLGRRYDVDRVYLFGSYARGEQTAESDVDLRIDEGDIGGLFALSGLWLALRERMGKKVDLLTTDSLDETFLKKIQPEEILLYERERP